MARPVVSPLAEQVYAQLRPLATRDDQLGWSLLLLVGLLAQPFAEIDELVGDSDNGPGWSILFDVDRCPAKWLPFTAGLVGARLTPGASEAAWRDEIRAHAAFMRGTPTAMTATVARYLTGNRRVTLIERDGSPWRLTIITYTGETPTANVTALVAAAGDQAPAGVVVTHRIDPGWSVGQLEDAYSTRTVGDIEAGFTSVGNLESNLP